MQTPQIAEKQASLSGGCKREEPEAGIDADANSAREDVNVTVNKEDSMRRSGPKGGLDGRRRREEKWLFFSGVLGEALWGWEYQRYLLCRMG